MRTIDLNCDIGEMPELRAVDLELMRIISSANIACGGHAGDAESMRAMVAAAKACGVTIGAHPSYPDRAGFGRMEVRMASANIEREVAGQVGDLARVAREAGAELAHVKPHGALYHAAMHSREVALAVGKGAIAGAGGRIALVGQAGSQGLLWWAESGWPVLAEAFADRVYEADGRLRSRSKAGAVIDDAGQAAEQALSIAEGRGVAAVDGYRIDVRADTICIHGDTTGAAELARAIRTELERRGIAVVATKVCGR